MIQTTVNTTGPEQGASESVRGDGRDAKPEDNNTTQQCSAIHALLARNRGVAYGAKSKGVLTRQGRAFARERAAGRATRECSGESLITWNDPQNTYTSAGDHPFHDWLALNTTEGVRTRCPRWKQASHAKTMR